MRGARGRTANVGGELVLLSSLYPASHQVKPKFYDCLLRYAVGPFFRVRISHFHEVDLQRGGNACLTITRGENAASPPLLPEQGPCRGTTTPPPATQRRQQTSYRHIRAQNGCQSAEGSHIWSRKRVWGRRGVWMRSRSRLCRRISGAGRVGGHHAFACCCLLYTSPSPRD